ncbi:hypothetical protein BH11MYX1_BH11MYX1_15870 [soil metagenome]
MMMRTLLALVLLASLGAASPAASKGANARGMALMGKKMWAWAEAEFKTAVSAPSDSMPSAARSIAM